LAHEKSPVEVKLSILALWRARSCDWRVSWRYRSFNADGLSVSEIARRLDLDRKTVRKYLREAPRAYERKPKGWKVDGFPSYLRERWEQGVRNSCRLFREIRKRGYEGGLTQVKKVVRP
jgi:transposase